VRLGVITGLVPVIHVLLSLPENKNVDGRDKPGHDGWIDNLLAPDRISGKL